LSAQVVVVSSWGILHHVVATMTMTKIRIISAKIENNTLLLTNFIKQDIENIMAKKVM
jgi:hypothetical protein